ncbi:MAG: DUF433 domain-containing protein [Saprospiraceae bacterium]|nr:DUF433 domain-containing protein [Saprospiraceae bacterium]
MQVQFPGFPHIVTDPTICEGQPRIDGTRITVSAILSYIAGGLTVDDLLAEYPKLTREYIHEALSFATANLQGRYIPLRSSVAA